MNKPCLQGIRVLDFTRVLSGPFCTALLADLGAEVIKIESPQGDDYRHIPPFSNGTGGLFLLLNRGKKSVSIDLKTDRGKDILRALAGKSDIIVENFRPGVMDRMGLGYEEMSRENPRLIQASISGFGQKSRNGHLPAYDLVIQALTGFMDVTGDPDGAPMMTGESVADLTAGLFASWSILAALLSREQTGRGQMVDVAMFDCLFSFLPAALTQHLYGSAPPTRVGNRHPLGAPFGVFAASDGHYTIAVLNPAQFRKLAKAMGQAGLADDIRFASNAARMENHATLKDLIEDWSRSRIVSETIAILQKHDVPCSPIVSVPEAASGSQAEDRGLLRRIKRPDGDCITTLSQPVKFSTMEIPDTTAPPELGGDNQKVLSDLLQMSKAEMEDLYSAGVLHGQ